MRRTWFYAAALAALAIWAAIAFAYASNPPASRTNAAALGGIAAEGNCTSCHGGNALNSGGSVTLLGLPYAFQGGVTYHLTVHLVSSQTSGSSRTWGFEMTAVDSATGSGTGTFVVVDATQTSIVAGSGSYATRRYARQSSGGDQTGTASPVEWQVDWTAPAPGATGTVKFFFVGLAGNGSGTSGDWVYTGSTATYDVTTPALPRTWGQVKSEYLK